MIQTVPVDDRFRRTARGEVSQLPSGGIKPYLFKNLVYILARGTLFGVVLRLGPVIFEEHQEVNAKTILQNKVIRGDPTLWQASKLASGATFSTA
jgi:hypothetical protein